MTRPASRLSSFHESAPALRVLKWVVAPLLAIHVVLASISGYRAIVQVYHVDIALASPTLNDGSAIRLSVATSGRATVDTELELIQPSHAETLAVLFVRGHENASYDPRTINAAKSVTLTTEQLAHFRPGHAVLRATANGRSQWLRIPPPVIAERSVEIAPRLETVASKPLGGALPE
jgi:hypothetical protein